MPRVRKGRAEIYDPPGPGHFDSAPDYSDGCTFDLTSAKFSFNSGYWKKSKAEAAAHWKGQLLSGRYAQDREIPKGLIEKFTSIPKELRKQPDFWQRGSLPHHDEIAVDQAKRDAAHRLYNTKSAGPDRSPGLPEPVQMANQRRLRAHPASISATLATTLTGEGPGNLCVAVYLQCARRSQQEKYSYLWSRFPTVGVHWPERWLSGLKHTPGKREWAYTPPWVRIPVSPPTFTSPPWLMLRLVIRTG